MQPSKDDLHSTLEFIAQKLRGDGENITRQKLPKRWVELIHYLDEQEQRSKEQEAAKVKPSQGDEQL